MASEPRNGRGSGRARLAGGAAFLLAVLVFVGAQGSATGDDPDEPAPPPAMEGAGDGGDEDGEPGLQERIGEAIEKGVEWLKARQTSDGCWGTRITGPTNYAGGTDSYTYPAGLTALAVYTLLKCKVPAEDAAVVKGLAWLKRNFRIPATSYEASMSLLAVTATADPFKKTRDSRAAGDRVKLSKENRAWATELKDALLARRAPVAWRYYAKGNRFPGGDQDLSSTQLAALALFAADRCGIRVENPVWAGLVGWVESLQEKDGPEADRAIVLRAAKPALPGGSPGGYAPAESPVKDRARGFVYTLDVAGLHSDFEKKATGSMTACGVATLALARYVLTSRGGDAWKGLDPRAADQSVLDGLAWLDVNWHPYENPPENVGTYHVYYLYCVERAMDLVGANRLGKRFWYVEMARHLVGIQREKGSWDTDSGHEPSEWLDTCFALLFLERATRGAIPLPVVTGDDAEADGAGK